MTLLTAGSRQTNPVRQPRTQKAWWQNPEGAEVPETAAGRPATTYHIRRSVTDPGSYLAIPSRSFRPVAVTVETKTNLKLT